MYHHVKNLKDLGGEDINTTCCYASHQQQYQWKSSSIATTTYKNMCAAVCRGVEDKIFTIVFTVRSPNPSVTQHIMLQTTKQWWRKGLQKGLRSNHCHDLSTTFLPMAICDKWCNMFSCGVNENEKTLQCQSPTMLPTTTASHHHHSITNNNTNNKTVFEVWSWRDSGSEKTVYCNVQNNKAHH